MKIRSRRTATFSESNWFLIKYQFADRREQCSKKIKLFFLNTRQLYSWLFPFPWNSTIWFVHASATTGHDAICKDADNIIKLFLFVSMTKVGYLVFVAKYFDMFLPGFNIVKSIILLFCRFLSVSGFSRVDREVREIWGQDGLFRVRGTYKPSPLKNGEKSNQNRSWIEFPSSRMAGSIPWKESMSRLEIFCW